MEWVLVSNLFSTVGSNFQMNSTAMVVCAKKINVGNNAYIAHDVWI